MATQSEIAANIITQLRLLDPSVSAIIGTPERKIIDAVAQAIAGYQVDINMLNGALDIDVKYGTDLDNMLAIFGFGRQQGSKASGYVTFSVDAAKSSPILISAGTQLLAPAASAGSDVIFIVSRSVTLAANTTSVVAPVECIASGSFGNISANTITAWNQTAITGISSLNNDSPIVGGADSESDEALKSRFKASGPFRNLAGTQDQYLALALSTFTTKASVIGPVSRYKEYIQVPSVDDTQSIGGYTGNGSNALNYTTTLSTNTNAKYVYSNLPFYVSDDTTGIVTPYVQDIDYVANLNPADKNKGDAYRNYQIDPTNYSNPTSTASPTVYQPNVTFTNVYTGTDTTVNLVNPKNVLLFEYSYISSASRNDYNRGVLNCVDVYVNGSDPQLSTAVIARPGASISVRKFNNTDSTSALYYDNFRRVGDPNHRPIVGNLFTPLLNQPIIDLPSTINISEATFIKGIHYWAVEDVSPLRGTVRARNGIEWSATVRSKVGTDTSGTGPFNGPFITEYSAIQTVLTLGVTNAAPTTSAPVYLFVDDASTLPQTATVQIDNERIQYTKSTETTWVAGTYGYTTINQTGGITNVLGSVTAETFTVATSSGLDSTGGYLLIDQEIIKYSTFSGSTVTIAAGGRGQFGTVASAHANSVKVQEYVTYAGAAYVNVATRTSSNTSDPSADTANWTKKADILVVNTSGRGANNTTAAAHTLGTSVKTPVTTSDQVLSIENYIYDANIVNLQAALEGSKQVTTDVLAHKAKVRYFKPDITVMYNAGSNSTAVNSYIQTSLNSYFNSLYFGGAVQLSDILQVIHNTAGVDNVRWSKDVLGSATKDSDGNPRNRLTETNVNGDPLLVALDQIYFGDGGTATKYKLYFSNATIDALPSLSGTFTIQYGSQTAQSVTYSNTSAILLSNIQTAMNGFGSVINTITGSGTVADPFIITYTSKSDKNALVIGNTERLTGGPNIVNSDFFLKDDELAALPVGKTVNGTLDITSVMTIRVKAQNTWNQING